MKKALKLTLAVALMMGATSLYAQKFGRINSQEIVMAMPETKEMQTNLETFGKELNENIETINVEFNNKLQEYQKTANTLTDAVREMKAKELEDLQRRSQEFQQMAQRDYAKKQEELLQPIIEKAKAAIDKIAAAGGYLFVFDTSAGCARSWALPTPRQPLRQPRPTLRNNSARGAEDFSARRRTAWPDPFGGPVFHWFESGP